MQTISTAPEGTYNLKQMPAGQMPGIQREENESSINVTYENRFTLFDQDEQAARSVI